MSIQSFQQNLVDLVVFPPRRDRAGGNAPVGNTVLTNIPCSVQPSNFGTTRFYDSQYKVVGVYSIYFRWEQFWETVVDDVIIYNHIRVKNITPTQDYQFRYYNNLWTPTSSIWLRLLGWGEDTKGTMQLWRADCEQTS